MRLMKFFRTMKLIFTAALFAATLLSMQNSFAENHSPEMKNMADPIGDLVKKLNGLNDGGSWANGASPIIDLPSTASADEVMQEYFKAYKDSKPYHIEEIRMVHIGFQDYRAVFISRDLKKYIIVLQKNSGTPCWWTKEFDVNGYARK